MYQIKSYHVTMRWLIRVTAWERKSLWRRIPCALGRVALLCVLLDAFGAMLGPPLTALFLIRREAKLIPGLNVVPRPLTDYSVSDASGTTLSYFGYSFDVPWNAHFQIRQASNNSSTSGIVGLEFASGQYLIVIAPKNQDGLLSEIAQDPSLGGANFGLEFSDLIKRSAYDQYSALLNTSPSTIRAFGPRAEAARGQLLLMIKGIALPVSLKTGAFSFQFPNKRGFQIGDPGKSKRIDLEILDLEGHYVEIICSVRNDIWLTQPELNRILKTIHTVPVLPVTVKASSGPPGTMAGPDANVR